MTITRLYIVKKRRKKWKLKHLVTKPQPLHFSSEIILKYDTAKKRVKHSYFIQYQSFIIMNNKPSLSLKQNRHNNMFKAPSFTMETIVGLHSINQGESNTEFHAYFDSHNVF